MNPRKLVSVLALALLLVTSGAGGSARHDADVLVALGAGVAGTWETEIEFANLEDRTITVFAGEEPHPIVCITSPCAIAYSTLPGNGAARLVATSADFARFTGRLFVGADDAEELPTVRARVVNRARPSQTIELPLFRRSTLVARNPGVLAFPFLLLSAGEHSNLFVSEIGLSSDLVVTIEAFAFSGERLSYDPVARARRNPVSRRRPVAARGDGHLGGAGPSGEDGRRRDPVGTAFDGFRRWTRHRRRRKAPVGNAGPVCGRC